MTWQGWLQIAVFAALITATVKPVGAYIARSIDGSGRVRRALAPIENALYRLAGVNPADEQSWMGYALALLWFHLAGIVALYALQRLQNLLPLNPQQFDAVAARSGTEHGGQLRHEHKLAVLWRRSDTLLPRANGGHHRPVIPLRCDRCCRRDRSGPRLCTSLGTDDRQFLGRSYASHTLRPAADLRDRRAVPGLAGRAANARHLCQRDDIGRRQSGPGAWAGRLAEGDRGAERRRWRLLQRQLARIRSRTRQP